MNLPLPRPRRNRLGWACLALLGAVLALGGCGQAGAGPATSGPSPATSGAGTSSASTAASASAASSSASASAAGSRSHQVQLYFSAAGKLAAEPADVQGKDVARATLDALLVGPTKAGLYTDIPRGSQVLSLAVQSGVAQVSFDPQFFISGGSAGTQLRLGQVVYSLTQFPAIHSVQFLQQGHILSATGGEGFPLDKPLARPSFSSIAP
ncbi:MAG: GerMN domain-containing protein [Chloroflexota bacterium]